ncbi:hypothetical protein B0T16DRAFT_447289 [Cercophora newfieldiana]|uniref:Zn(2)-C6 fungal-type domain-containing protein n=1 Tax=Cercophora newfieldiana TaxID=92897 RepID=A0AA39XZS9_9PEZI|nr:hypothetical protein B0T16DRAFT_447289 [Cercophora newfieldiana]
MFITLRTAGSGVRKQNEKVSGGMEQVAQRTAAQIRPGERVRSLRRNACLQCQSKKLRCTGSTRDRCDRCRSRSIDCVFPPGAGQSRSHSHTSHSHSSPDAPKADTPDGSLSPTGDTLDGTELPVLGRLSDELSQDEVFDLNANFEELHQDSRPLNLSEFDTSLLSVENGGHYQPQSLQSNHDTQSHSTLVQAEYLHPEQLQILSNTSTPENFSLGGVSFLSNQLQALPAVQIAGLGQDGSTGCSCLSDLLRVMEQLDDDEFKITTLAMDHVLQLQKWIIFQCCKPLDCGQHCATLPSVNTVLLCISDRLTEMFECLYKRLKAPLLVVILKGFVNGSNNHSPSSYEPPESTVSTSPAQAAQLFCSTTGQAANAAACVPALFAGELQAEYSSEEQIHMIRVLLRLQIRNFRQLLSRQERIQSVARKSKINSLLERLKTASSDIEGAFDTVIQFVSLN